MPPQLLHGNSLWNVPLMSKERKLGSPADIEYEEHPFQPSPICAGNRIGITRIQDEREELSASFDKQLHSDLRRPARRPRDMARQF